MSSYSSLIDGRTSYWRDTYRPRFRPGRTKPDYGYLWLKYRKYAPGYNNNVNNTDNNNINNNVIKDITVDGTKYITVDFLKTENRTAHLTDEYINTSLIVRRGQQFKVNIDLEVPFDKAQDRLQLLLSKGDTPMESKGTLVRLKIYNDKNTAERESAQNMKWYGYFSSITSGSKSATLKVIINPPSVALVGTYAVRTIVHAADLTGQKKRYVKEESESIYVLFNAWCKDDQVYLKDEAERQEYVINDKGRIWAGKHDSSFAWNFGQFDDYCLEAAVYLLDNCTFLTAQAHGNATLVTRAFSAMANSCSDNVVDKPGFKGVLMGNWSGNFSGGTPPTAWVGSQAILEEYMVTKSSVKFGQCWVFSAILTTLGRTLGIPTRSVTNFQSAHDTDFSLTIDTHFDELGAPMPHLDDSIWNFHVWNESWFTRPDLPDGYDGWQAYDSTPQEASEGIMRCGPVPVLAIKQGNVFYNYDGRFIFGEVNGDKVIWLVVNSDERYPVEKDTNAVGKFISTKQVGSDQRLDVTINYKYTEGSNEERQAVARASRFSSRLVDFQKSDFYNQTTDVKFVYNGASKPNGDVTVTLEMTNTSSEVRNVTLSLTAMAAYYTGVIAEELSSKTVQIVLDPDQTKTEEWSILAENYYKVIDADAKLKTYIMAKTAETNQVFIKNEMFEVQKPDLVLQVSKQKVAVGETFDLTIKFPNPLNMTLTKGFIMLAGPGIQKSKKIYIHRSVPANGELSETVQLTPTYKGKKEVIASFNCKELTGIYGSVIMEVI